MLRTRGPRLRVRPHPRERPGPAGSRGEPLPTKHAVTVAVAVTYVAISLAEGGFGTAVTAAGTLVIWWAVLVGLLTGGLPLVKPPRAALAAGAGLGGLALFTALSMAWASDDGKAFLDVVRAAGYLGLFVLVVLASGRASARSWLSGLAIGLVAVAVIAVASRLVPSLPGGDEEIAEALLAARGRLSYPIGYWNALAACMALAIVLLGWLGAQGRTPAVRAAAVGAIPIPVLAIYLTSSRGGVAATVIGVAALLALGPARTRLLAGVAIGGAGGLAVALLAHRRPALLGGFDNPAAEYAGQELLLATAVAVAIAAVARYLADGRIARLAVPRRVVRLSLAGAAILGLVAVLAANPAQRWEEFKGPPPATGEQLQSTFISSHLASATGNWRYQFWSAAGDAFASDPLKGIGAGGYEAWWYQHGSLARALEHAHSLFFETLAELGLPGLIFLLGFLGVGAVSGWRRRASWPGGGELGAVLALLVAGVVVAAVDWTWEIPAAFAPVVVAIALLTGPASRREEQGETRAAAMAPEARRPRSRRRRLDWRAPTFALGVAAVFAAGVVFITELRLDQSREAAREGDLALAAEDARKATSIQPWSAEPWLQLGLVAERAGDMRTARGALDEAIERSPEDWTVWFVASRIAEKSGRDKEVEHGLSVVGALNPLYPVLLRTGPRSSAEAQDESGSPKRGSAE